eukprot:TRINITY_DN9698_c0_g2_i1.p1 TRINITY_DN9698_c0_g2~~TRINITY_DN9698_c0_g2_i1.p1  ORF type:complete len:154 (-),score=35.15 TRINITY_DN9698_c0_g2_i1:378-839(-)
MSADSKGSELIESIIEAFGVNIVLVLDYERLYNELLTKYSSRVQIVKLEKLGGVSDSSITYEMRQKMIKAGITSYFGGMSENIKSYQISLPMSKYKIFKIFRNRDCESRGDLAACCASVRHQGRVSEYQVRACQCAEGRRPSKPNTRLPLSRH